MWRPFEESASWTQANCGLQVTGEEKRSTLATKQDYLEGREWRWWFQIAICFVVAQRAACTPDVAYGNSMWRRTIIGSLERSKASLGVCAHAQLNLASSQTFTALFCCLGCGSARQLRHVLLCPSVPTSVPVVSPKWASACRQAPLQIRQKALAGLPARICLSKSIPTERLPSRAWAEVQNKGVNGPQLTICRLSNAMEAPQVERTTWHSLTSSFLAEVTRGCRSLLSQIIFGEWTCDRSIDSLHVTVADCNRLNVMLVRL